MKVIWIASERNGENQKLAEKLKGEKSKHAEMPRRMERKNVNKQKETILSTLGNLKTWLNLSTNLIPLRIKKYFRI